MLDRLVPNFVNGSLDWFFKKVLKDQYDKRRQTLREAKKEAIPAIDYILSSYVDSKTSYPPESASQWNEYYSKLASQDNKVFKQVLLIYLKLDASNYFSQKDGSSKTRTKDKAEFMSLEDALDQLLLIPFAFDFTNSVIQLGTGLWAVDNGDTNLIVTSLGSPSINLANYFESPREIYNIIVDSLIMVHNPHMALFMSKIHRCESWDEDYDAIHAFLLVKSGQLIEALKYERMFSDKPNFNKILQHFFDLCSESNVTKSLNCLDLSLDEEEVLNQHLVYESRPVTPSGTQINSTSSSTAKSKSKPRNRSIQLVQRAPSFNDSPARNTRSARKRKGVSDENI